MGISVDQTVCLKICAIIYNIKRDQDKAIKPMFLENGTPAKDLIEHHWKEVLSIKLLHLLRAAAELDRMWLPLH